MKGKITKFKAEQGFGFVKDEDNKSYFFHISNVSNPMDIEENYTVDFQGKESDKGLVATQITVNTPLASGSKDRMLKLKDLRIRASDIKTYKINKIQSSDEDENGNYRYNLVGPSGCFYEDRDGTCTINEISSEYKRFGRYYNLDGCHEVDSTIDRIDSLRGLYYYCDGYDWAHEYPEKLSPHSSQVNCEYYTRDCYSIDIVTYTEGTKSIIFKSFDEELNKQEATKLLDYIDQAMDELI